MANGPICDCGHSESEHKMKYTKNFTFSIGNCRECLCEQYVIQRITITT